MELVIPLLDYLALRIGCLYLSDLRHLSCVDKLFLYNVVVKIEPEQESLKYWNDALVYITGQQPVKSCDEAKVRLLSFFMH